MKHIFQIHSNTCLITSLGVIKTEGISQKDVILLFIKTFEVSEEVLNSYQSIILDKSIVEFPFFAIRRLKNLKWMRTRSIINEIDSSLKEIISENPFVFYCQDLRHYLLNVVATNKNCTKVNFIEESYYAHLSKKEFNKAYAFRLDIKYKIINILFASILFHNFRKRLILQEHPFGDYKNSNSIFYALTDSSFSNYIESKYIKKVSLEPSLFGSINTKRHLLAFGALQEQNILSLDRVIEIYKHYLIQKDIKQVYIKFHPSQNEENRNRILYELRNINAKILEDNHLIENYLLQGNLNIISIGSSLIIYAAKLNKTNKPVALFKYAKKHVLQLSRYKQWEELYSNTDIYTPEDDLYS